MMKRKRTGALGVALLLCLLMAFPCSAAAPTESRETRIEVRARYIQESDRYTAPVENGEAAAALADGSSVAVSGVTGNGLWLVVYPIPKTDAQGWSWFESCMAAYGTNIYPMDIYFVDQDGNRVEVSRTVTVTVETLEAYASPVICHLSTEGNVTVMDSSVDGKRITFRTDHNSYYVLAEKKEEPGSETEETETTGSETEETETPASETEETETPASETEETETPGSETERTSGPAAGNSTRPGKNGSTGKASPKTGDDSDIWMWIALMCISGAGIAVILTRRKRRA